MSDYEQVKEFIRENCPKSFKSESDLEFATQSVFGRLTELQAIQDRGVDDVINYIETKKSNTRAINFPINSINMLTLISPNAQSTYNGLCQLPTRIDLLTGTRTVFPDHQCESLVRMEKVEGELIQPTITPSVVPSVPSVTFKLKRMRLK